jgi:hypothetical protein
MTEGLFAVSGVLGKEMAASGGHAPEIPCSSRR